MKLSKETLEILKNFGSINSNILIQPGNIIKTRSNVKTIGAFATVEETFPVEFGLYDLNQFISILSLFDEDPEFDFESNEEKVVIKGAGTSIQYGYSDRDVLSYTTKDEPQFDSVIKFDLSKSDLSKIRKASQLMGLTHIAVKSDGEEFYGELFHEDNSKRNTYKINLGDSDETTFNMIFKMDNLKMIDDDYTVEIAKDKISSFKSSTRKLSYFVALEEGSEYVG